MMMKAAVYHKFGGPITIENVPKPTLLLTTTTTTTTSSNGDGCGKDAEDDDDDGNGVIIKIMATGICRSDYHGWKGHDSDIIKHGLPFIPGHECSGYIVECGPKVQKLKLVIVLLYLSYGVVVHAVTVHRVQVQLYANINVNLDLHNMDHTLNISKFLNGLTVIYGSYHPMYHMSKLLH